MPLPPLREDLNLTDGPPLENGAPSWTIHDPVRGRYYRVGRLEFALLSRWAAGSVEALVDRVNRETTLSVGPEEVLAFVRFVEAHQLVAPEDAGARQRLATLAGLPQEALWRRVLHRYLFFRIPLVHPDRFLDATLFLVRPLGRSFCLRLLALAGLLAVWLTIRRWDEFTHTFLYFFSPEGLAWYVGALVLAKLVHELGHAYTAKHHGTAVPSLGVAFIVLWPVLYTDNTDAWQVPSRRARMSMVAAGVLAELALAVVATLLWHVLPDGPARSACFVLATVTWVGSVMINLSPFMRFDGYYLLSDFLDVPNLQPRAFALGRWFMRRHLLGLRDPCPEPMAPGRVRLLAGYALATWIYRLVVFTAIALAVYHLFFKLLGIALFAVEIGWFLLRPVGGELALWWRRRHDIGLNPRLAVTLALALVILALGLVPRRGTLQLPALLAPIANTAVHAPQPARIVRVRVREGQPVAAGAPIFELARPEIDHRSRQVALHIEMLQLQLQRSLSRQDLAEQHGVIVSELAAAMAEREALGAERRRLVLKAPHAGIVVDLAEGLRPGRWVRPGLRLARIVDGRQYKIEAFVAEQDLARVHPGAAGRFYPDRDHARVVSGRVAGADPTSLRRIESAYMASTYGGRLAARVSPDGLTAQDSVYRVRLAPVSLDDGPGQILVGIFRLEAPPACPLAGLARRAMALIIRESGF